MTHEFQIACIKDRMNIQEYLFISPKMTIKEKKTQYKHLIIIFVSESHNQGVSLRETVEEGII